jgi:hypothetical protein
MRGAHRRLRRHGQRLRASFTEEIVGIRVYRDASDRWVSSRRVWNQHAYAVTMVDEDGTIPRTSAMRRNWSTMGTVVRPNGPSGL